MQLVDIREQVVDVPQEVITEDNVVVSVDAVVYYEATDPQRLIYNVADFFTAITKLAQTNLRNLIGDLELDKALTSRDTINLQLREVLDDATDKWGVPRRASRDPAHRSATGGRLGNARPDRAPSTTAAPPSPKPEGSRKRRSPEPMARSSHRSSPPRAANKPPSSTPRATPKRSNYAPSPNGSAWSSSARARAQQPAGSAQRHQSCRAPTRTSWSSSTSPPSNGSATDGRPSSSSPPSSPAYSAR